MPEHGLGVSQQQDPDLESLLRAAQSLVEFPQTPEIWPAIADELIVSGGVPGMRHVLPPGRAWPSPIRLLASLAVVLAMVTLTLLAFPDLRTAVAERLGLTGVIIRFVDEPPATTAPPGSTLNLGQPVSLAEAEQTAGFAIRVPAAAELGTPDAVYITYGVTNPIVSLVYLASDTLPTSRYSGVGALITQFEGDVNGPMIAKSVMTDSTIRRTKVGDVPAFWVEGAAHFFMYQPSSRDLESDEYRLAGHVLLWESGGITYRLESELTEAAAIAVAESMGPFADTAGGTD